MNQNWEKRNRASLEIAREFQVEMDSQAEDVCMANSSLMPELQEKIDLQVWLVAGQRIESRKRREPKLDMSVSNDDASAEVSSIFPDIQSFTDRYAPQQQIDDGDGAFGKVIKCEDRKLGRVVAIKKLKQHNSYEAGLMEARVTASTHDEERVVQILEIARIGEQTLLIYEYVPGYNLAKRIREGGKFSHKESARIIQQIALGLHGIHKAGFAHSDIKPSNIIIGVRNKPTIVDLGLAFPLDSGIPRGSTKAYQAPEHASQGRIDHRVDIYSLGVVFHELLTGRRPEEQGSNKDQNQSGSMRKRNPSIPRDLEAICLRCLEPQPMSRYQSAEDVAHDIDNYFGKRVLRGRPNTPPSERFVKYVRRNALVLSALAFTLLIATWFVVSEMRNHHSAKKATLAEKLRREEAEADAQARTRMAADIAGKRGQWIEMLDALTAAENQFGGSGHLLDFEKLVALDALGRTRERDKAIERLLQTQPSDPFRKAAILLWKADVLDSQGNYQEADQFIAQAKAIGLTPADENYANAIQARTTDKAIHFLEEAIRLQSEDPSKPYHYRANAQLAAEYFMMGRLSKFETQCQVMMFAFPHDPQFPFLLGIHDCLFGQLGKAKRRVRNVDSLDPDTKEQILTVYELLAQAMAKDVSLTTAFKGMQQLGVVGSQEVSSAIGLRVSRRHQVLSLNAIQYAVGFGQKNALGKIIEVNPEPSLVTLLSLYRLNDSPTVEDKAEIQKQLREICDSEFLIPELKAWAIDLAYSLSFRSNEKFSKEDQADVNRYIEDFFPNPPQRIAAIAGIYASDSGDHERALFFLMQPLSLDFEYWWDDGHLAIWGAYSALKLENHELALKLLDHVSVMPIRKPPLTVEQIRTQAKSGLLSVKANTPKK